MVVLPAIGIGGGYSLECILLDSTLSKNKTIVILYVMCAALLVTV